MPNVWLIFTTGLLTGGITCMAVQGSLLATAMAAREGEVGSSTKSARALAVAVFLGAKLIAYTILGFILGFIGSLFTFSIPLQITFMVLITVFMVGSALNMLAVHPFFRIFSLAPPKFVRRLIWRESKQSDLFAPAILGLMTVLVPCGTTQAMMVLAVGSGSALAGMLTMAAFVLGTIPIFFVLGYGMGSLKDVFKKNFNRIAAAVILLLAIWNADSALTLTGTPFTLRNGLAKLQCAVSFCGQQSIKSDTDDTAVVEATVKIGMNGYTLDNNVLKAGAKVTLHVINEAGYGCIQSFTIPKLGIQTVIPVGQSEDITFTVPSDMKDLAFMCSMGMYRGEFSVR